MFKKILIANRGEIALRVIRTCKEMGIKTVAVYSKADEESLHVRFADEAVCIGPAPSNQSYLKIPNIIAAAEITNADAIHPGYGFLSENSKFSKICAEHEIKFIGASGEQIDKMGDKATAKETMKKAGVPCVPGSDGLLKDVAHAKREAKKMGYPVMIKATAGGGGKGMRAIWKEEELEANFESAVQEATASFGNGGMYMEKLIEEPRHIEIQVMADTHGNVLHFFERECSIQRRHQKVVEEAPSSLLTPALRNAMGDAAVKVAKACDYVGAGTVEFLMDADMNFYFLEMNTRLQVEHPVTEMVTGVDLVEFQIKVARGEALPLSQSDITIEGHAMELRVYAEDPLNDFLPSVGQLETYRLPEGEGIRVDNGFEEGMDVPIYYDPMLSKLITYGKTREEAIELILKAIENYKIKGVQTTLPFGTFVFEHEAFRSGDFDTHFVKNHYSPEAIKSKSANEAEVAAMMALKIYFEDQKIVQLPSN